MNEALLVLHEGARISSIYGTYAYGEAGRAVAGTRISGYLFGAGGTAAGGEATRGAAVPDRPAEPEVRAA
jgi:hypothetical protein